MYTTFFRSKRRVFVAILITNKSEMFFLHLQGDIFKLLNVQCLKVIKNLKFAQSWVKFFVVEKNIIFGVWRIDSPNSVRLAWSNRKFLKIEKSFWPIFAYIGVLGSKRFFFNFQELFAVLCQPHQIYRINMLD